MTSANAPELSDRVFIQLSAGPGPGEGTAYDEEDLWRANLAISMANRALAANRPVTLFLDVHGPNLARTDLPESLNFASEPPLKHQFSEFIEKGGTVIVCPLCAETLGLAQSDLVPGAVMDDSGIFGSEGLEPGTASLSF
ncbi:Genome sequencing data, contig C323 [Hoyosella subflava DQS3-9A1]|uniref:Genome sequencing data, contig C323 n=1 Tax=Hoyosella subflava (strain DSM 45089 / JCM 17490 / NBRC 109087 / DQS3-9A1) TaxID=443218 RepID=F6EI60_HOYSD|nr:Genome sequencing data, contig C323 [Hoyosella subflava DQS3-9A1]